MTLSRAQTPTRMTRLEATVMTVIVVGCLIAFAAFILAGWAD